MLVELKKLNITNTGYKREISIDKIYVNSNHIISIADYSGANDFLLSEGSSQFAEKKFSLVRISTGEKMEQIIALGSSEDVFSKLSVSSKKEILNG